MSLSPEPLPSPRISPEISPEIAARGRRRRAIIGLFFALLAFETGLFLVIFPWLDNWEFNYFQGITPALENLWDDPYFRGAVTGLGFVNLYIACLQIYYLIRRPRRS